ncbi:MAG: hypothetical protein CM15mP120_02690 [Pseudomonadota bacterium]|nr:MAG: hypothetical protein CM15mP120_02690 [Pseudomonadota bacterium]
MSFGTDSTVMIVLIVEKATNSLLIWARASSTMLRIAMFVETDSLVSLARWRRALCCGAPRK